MIHHRLLRRRSKSPAQQRRQEIIGRLEVRASIFENGVAKILDRVWNVFELDMCIDALTLAKQDREEIKKIETQPLRKTKPRGRKGK